MVDPRTALYAIVDSICETCDEITGVKIDCTDSLLDRNALDLR